MHNPLMFKAQSVIPVERIARRPVILTTMTEDVETVPPKKRIY
jgi:hypothetical protein